jgi:hypothetical protein
MKASRERGEEVFSFIPIRRVKPITSRKIQKGSSSGSVYLAQPFPASWPAAAAVQESKTAQPAREIPRSDLGA